MGSPPDEADNYRNWPDLPGELMESILLRLGAVEILISVQMVCSSWRRLCKEPSVWRSVDMCSHRNPAIRHEKLRPLCREAVSRSCGQVVDINIEYFGTTRLLKDITRSASKLKRLRLVSCNISGERLSKAAAKLPLLEELDISYCSISRDLLAAVGRSCPLLKTLKRNGYGHYEHNVEGFAIAQYMPEIRHVQLVGKNLTDVGVQAMLDRCPHLESLDIRRCFGVTLAGNLGKRCAEQIKDFRGPFDSTDDYEYPKSKSNITSDYDGFDDFVRATPWFLRRYFKF